MIIGGMEKKTEWEKRCHDADSAVMVAEGSKRLKKGDVIINKRIGRWVDAMNG